MKRSERHPLRRVQILMTQSRRKCAHSIRFKFSCRLFRGKTGGIHGGLSQEKQTQCSQGVPWLIFSDPQKGRVSVARGGQLGCFGHKFRLSSYILEAAPNFGSGLKKKARNPAGSRLSVGRLLRVRWGQPTPTNDQPTASTWCPPKDAESFTALFWSSSYALSLVFGVKMCGTTPPTPPVSCEQHPGDPGHG